MQQRRANVAIVGCGRGVAEDGCREQLGDQSQDKGGLVTYDLNDKREKNKRKEKKKKGMLVLLLLQHAVPGLILCICLCLHALLAYSVWKNKRRRKQVTLGMANMNHARQYVSKEAIANFHAPPIFKYALEAAFLDVGVGQVTPGRSRAHAIDVIAADILAAADELIFALQGLVVLGSVVGSARQDGP
jgi:hypothetical protein